MMIKCFAKAQIGGKMIQWPEICRINTNETLYEISDVTLSMLYIHHLQ